VAGAIVIWIVAVTLRLMWRRVFAYICMISIIYCIDVTTFTLYVL
jgi:hypothetical protein